MHFRLFTGVAPRRYASLFEKRVIDLFEEFGIRSERMIDLGNKFLGTSGNPMFIRQRYARYIQEHPELVRALGTRLHEDGPVVLLDRRGEHAGSEREIVAQALADLGVAFHLLIRAPGGATQVTKLIPRQSRKVSGRKKRRRSAAPAQDELPFDSTT